METPQAEDLSNLIINFLPNDATDEELKAMFEPFGEINHYKVVKDKVTNAPLGYGFVRFSKPEFAQAAINTLNGRVIRGKTIRVSVAHKSAPSNRAANVYVAHLPDNYDETAVKVLFSPYGTVSDVKIMRDPATQKSRGAGFVHFTTPDEAMRAIAALNGTQLAGGNAGGGGLVVRLANTPGQKQQRPPMQMPARGMVPYGMYNPMMGMGGMMMPPGYMMGAPTGAPMMGPMGGSMVPPPMGGNMMPPAPMGNSMVAPQMGGGAAVQPMSGQAPGMDMWSMGGTAAQAGAAGYSAAGYGAPGYGAPGYGAPGMLPASQMPTAPASAPGMGMGMGMGQAQGGYAQMQANLNPMQAPIGASVMSPVGTPAQGMAGGVAGRTAPYSRPQTAPVRSGSIKAPPAGGASQFGESQDGITPGPHGWCLFVYNLPECTEDMLMMYFAPYGHVNNVKIVYDIQTMRSKGFGFVNYANYGDATAAIAAMNGYVMGARTLQVSFKKSK